MVNVVPLRVLSEMPVLASPATVTRAEYADPRGVQVIDPSRF